MKEYHTILENDQVRLQPLAERDISELLKIGCDPAIWRWFSADLTNPDDLEKWMKDRLAETDRGTKMSYLIIAKEGNERIAGSTSYGNIDWSQRVIEIGWTWLGIDFIGSGLNKYMKFLMLSHAFNEMDISRVEIRTDEINVRSRRAIEKIGATLDGILRSHRITQGGRRRNTAIYSIIKEDWPEIRETIFKNQ